MSVSLQKVGFRVVSCDLAGYPVRTDHEFGQHFFPVAHFYGDGEMACNAANYCAANILMAMARSPRRIESMYDQLRFGEINRAHFQAMNGRRVIVSVFSVA